MLTPRLAARTLLAVALSLTVGVPLGAALTGCPVVTREPTIDAPPDGCVSGATLCHRGAPWRCAANRWSQADRECARLGTDASLPPVCCATQSALRESETVAACVPVAACIGAVSQ